MDETPVLRKALTRALNRMYTPLGPVSQRIKLTEDQVNRMDFDELKLAQQRALVIVYGPTASLPSGEFPPAIDQVVKGAKEVIDIVNRILEVKS